MNNIKIFAFTILLGSSLKIEAATNNSSEIGDLLNWGMDNVLLVIAGLALIVLFGILYNSFMLLAKNQQREYLSQHGIDLDQIESNKATSTPLWKSIYDKAWSLIPMDREKTIDLGHDYDGIRELDNSLPPWWLYLFFITILWGVYSVYVNHFADSSMSSTEKYAQEMEDAHLQKVLYLAGQANAVDETNVEFLDDEASLAAGKELFIKSCAACHGMEGQGGVGPNFADEYWIHGGDIKDLFKTIKYGVPEKGMISWSSQLQPKSMQNVASYILTLQGTNPPNQKAPEGQKHQKEAEDQDLTMN